MCIMSHLPLKFSHIVIGQWCNISTYLSFSHILSLEGSVLEGGRRYQKVVLLVRGACCLEVGLVACGQF